MIVPSVSVTCATCFTPNRNSTSLSFVALNLQRTRAKSVTELESRDPNRLCDNLPAWPYGNRYQRVQEYQRTFPPNRSHPGIHSLCPPSTQFSETGERSAAPIIESTCFRGLEYEGSGHEWGQVHRPMNRRASRLRRDWRYPRLGGTRGEERNE